jgi:hypothetical protein
MCHRLLLRRGTGADSPVTAVIADAVDCGVVDHGRVIDVVNVGDIHVAHGTVVIKLSALPTSTLITVTEVSVAVTDSAIEAHLLAPITVVEDVSVAAPSPIGWSPEQSRFRSHDPRARHPVVAFVSVGVGPVPRCPKITIAGTEWLLVDRQLWRGE